VSPVAGLVIDAAGNLYGVASGGGSARRGTVFELKRQANGTWIERVLYNFKDNAADGAAPIGRLILDAAGNLYGTTMGGGFDNAGTVFELKREAGGNWRERVLHSFANNGIDGILPWAGLVFDTVGNLFGTSASGGSSGMVTVFELSPNGTGGWTESILYNFRSDGTDGNFPDHEVILDGTGNLYGTTVQGGASNLGTVFELSPDGSGDWTEKVLHSFTHDSIDGESPTSGLIFDVAGNFYGTTYGGGTAGAGTVFKITP
jgi:uncharacterized repeat protein (TIGR03803 family)